MNNHMEIRLDHLCLRQYLKSTIYFEPKNPLTEDVAVLVWRLATRIIPKVYGQDGSKALHLMKMLAYLQDHRIPIEIIKEVNETDLPNSEKILTRDGFMTSNLYEIHDEVHGDIYLHSEILKKVIRDSNQSKQEELLRECLTNFKIERFHTHYYSIWTLALDYDDLFKKFHHPGDFHEYYYKVHKYLELFEREIAKYVKTYGELDERTMKVKAHEVSCFFKFDGHSCDSKWGKWVQFRPDLEDFWKKSGFVNLRIRPIFAFDETKDIISTLLSHLFLQAIPMQLEYKEKLLNEVIWLSRNILENNIADILGYAFRTMLVALNELNRANEIPALLREPWCKNMIIDPVKTQVPVDISKLDDIIFCLGSVLEITRNIKTEVAELKFSILSEFLSMTEELYKFYTELERNCEEQCVHCMCSIIVLMQTKCLMEWGREADALKVIQNTDGIRKINCAERECPSGRGLLKQARVMNSEIEKLRVQCQSLR